MYLRFNLASFAVLALAASNAMALVSYGTAGATYGENFDGLAATSVATSTSFTNDSTINGFYAFYSGATSGGTGIIRNAPDTAAFIAADNYYSPVAATGSRFYSYGQGSDRAFGGSTGSTARNATNNSVPGDFYYALVLQNTTGAPLTSFTLSYAGEQWAEAAIPTTTPQTIRVDYKTASTFSGADIATSTTFGTYAALADLSFSAPQNGATAAAVVDGNDASHRAVLSGSVGLTWNPNEYLILRFFDDDSAGNDHGLAIDDVAFSATGSSNVPEPTGLCGALLAVAGWLGRRRRA